MPNCEYQGEDELTREFVGTWGYLGIHTFSWRCSHWVTSNARPYANAWGQQISPVLYYQALFLLLDLLLSNYPLELKVETMARFSQEHFKSNPSTPMRKPSRLKEMFKHRQGSGSKLASPKTLSKLPPSMTDPQASPTVKEGFEQVGLLPSERTSLETMNRVLNESDGKTIIQTIESDTQEPEHMSVAPNFDPNLNVSEVTQADKVTEREAKQQKLNEEQSSTQSHIYALPKQQIKEVESDVDFAAGASLPTLFPETTDATDCARAHKVKRFTSHDSISNVECSGSK